MNAKLFATILEITIDNALEFMANKAGCSKEQVEAVILADPNGNTARYFRDLLDPKNLIAALNK